MSALTAVIVRLALLLRPDPLWYDETFSVLVARLPLDRLIAATAGDVHPPLYYLLLKAWLALWPSAPVEVWARALSLLFSLIALGLWALALWGMDDVPDAHKRIAFSAACFMPGLVYYSIEARMYALLAVLILAAWVLLLDERPLWAGAFLGLGALTHNIGLLYAIAVGLTFVLYRRAWIAVWMVTAAAGVALVVFSPWAAVIIRQMAQTRAAFWVWLPTPGTVAYMLFQAQAMARSVPDGLDAALMLLVAGVTTFGLWQARRVAAAWLPVIVTGLAVIASYVTGTGILLHRALIPAVFFLTLAWAAMCTRPAAGRVLAALAIVAAVYSNALYLVDGRTGADYSVLSAMDAQPGDVVLALSFNATPLSVYGDMPVWIADVAYEIGVGAGLSAQTATALGLNVVDLHTAPWARAWLVWTETPGLEDHPYIDGLVARYGGELVTTWEAGGRGELWLLQR